MFPRTPLVPEFSQEYVVGSHEQMLLLGLGLGGVPPPFQARSLWPLHLEKSTLGYYRQGTVVSMANLAAVAISDQQLADSAIAYADRPNPTLSAKHIRDEPSEPSGTC